MVIADDEDEEEGFEFDSGEQEEFDEFSTDSDGKLVIERFEVISFFYY